MVTARQKRAVALCAVLPLALAIAGCGGGDGDDKPSAGPSTVTTTPALATASADPQAAEKAAVLASYDAMWVEQMKAYKAASAKGTDLKKYATLNALSKFEVDLAQMKKSGSVGTGELGHAPEVTVLEAGGKLPKATIQDCIDLSKWKAVRTGTGEPIPLPTNQPKRYMATATAEKWPNGWMVTDYTPDGARTC